MQLQDRLYYVDIMKAIAIVFVISIHSLFHVGFYNEPIIGFDMYLTGLFRTFWVTCVPLFLIATGLLQGNKEINKKHYFGIINILVVFLISGLLCTIFTCLMKFTKGQQIDILTVLFSFTNFTAAPYGWYVAMFLGLYLFIPFINIVWKSIDRNKKIVLLLSLSLLTIIPNTFNSVNINSVEIFNSSRDDHSHILDDFWVQLYPILYFCIGLFISNYHGVIKRIFKVKTITFILILVVVSFSLFNYYRYSDCFGWSLDISYGGIQPFSVSVLLSLILINVSNSNHSSIIVFLSKHTLPIYLLSYIADSIIYYCLKDYVNLYSYKVLILTIPLSIICSGLMAYPVLKVSKTISRHIVFSLNKF